ncbi:MAG: phage virion morphogenesis protein [Magnetospirillum sp. WYHS-4]
MTGITLSIDIQDAGAAKVLDRVIAAAEDLTPAMDDIGGHLVAAIQRRFELGRGPDGKPWKPSRRVEESKGGGQTLVDSGRLMQSVTHLAHADSVDVGTNVIYGAIHQFGGTIRAKKGKALAFGSGAGKVLRNSVTIPARPFLGLDADDKAEIAVIVRDHIERAMA